MPAVADLHLTGDRFIVHDTAVLNLPHATGIIRRHVGPDSGVTFTGHVDASAEPQWIDDLDEAEQLAAAAAFVSRELRAARDAHQAAIDAARAIR